MAVCGKIYKGQDISCGITQKGYVQDIVLVNLSDFETKGISVECSDSTSKYQATPVLKEGAKGVMFRGPAAGNIWRILANKTRDDNGFPQYEHGANLLISGVTEEQKCILAGLDKGLVVAFGRLKDYEEPTSPGETIPAIEIAGLRNGLTTNDYAYDIAESSGAVPIELRSLENSLEPDLPYIYVSTNPGSEILDFEALFENVE